MGATVRAATADDAADLARVSRDVLRDGRGAVMPADDAPDAAAMAERLARPGATLVLEVDGVVLGEGTISPFGPRWLRHVGVLALHVHPTAQGRGHGRALLRGLLDRARSLGLERVELYVRADNERAVALYRAEGFVLEGVRRGFVRVEGRRAVDDLLMARFFHPIRKEKVVPLVVRGDRGRAEVLAFTAPSGEVQLPRGTLEPGEEPARGVLRELAEECGITSVRSLGALPAWDQPQPESEDGGLPVLYRYHPFLFEPTTRLPEAWTWRMTGAGDEHGLPFRCEWQPVSETTVHPIFAETLDRLRAFLARRR